MTRGLWPGEGHGTLWFSGSKSEGRETGEEDREGEREDVAQIRERVLEREDSLKAEPTGWLTDGVCDVRKKNGGELLGFWQSDQNVPFADMGRHWARSSVWAGEGRTPFWACDV